MPFLEKGERSVSGDTMVARAAELKAELREEDGLFILEHRREIPQSTSRHDLYGVHEVAQPLRPSLRRHPPLARRGMVQGRTLVDGVVLARR